MAPQNELPLPPLQPQPVLGLGSWQWVSWLCLFSKEAQRWGKTQPQKAAVCESTVLYFQSVGLVKLDESVKVPPPGSSVLMARRLVFPPFHFLPVLLGQLKWKKQPVPQQTPAPGEKQRACSGDGLEWHSPGGGVAPPGIGMPGEWYILLERCQVFPLAQTLVAVVLPSPCVAVRIT